MLDEHRPKDGSGLLSDLISYMKYARHVEQEDRRETWKETVQRLGRALHRQYPHLRAETEDALKLVEQKLILPSMRFLQFAGPALDRHPSRIYNCSYLSIRRVRDVYDFVLNLLLGTGVGYSVQWRHVKQMPPIKGVQRDVEQVFTVEDTVEGWAAAFEHLFVSYTECLPRVIFDFTKIRPKGSPIKTAGGRAPGHRPLKKSLTEVQQILNNASPKQGESPRRLKPIEVFDALCMASDCISAGGTRRSATICLFDWDDDEMLTSKVGDWYGSHPWRCRANISAVLHRAYTSREQYDFVFRHIRENNTGEPGIAWTNDYDFGLNPCAEISLRSQGFCNVSTVNGGRVRTQQQLNLLVSSSAFLGTLQAGYDHFDYLSPEWSLVCKEDALIGVSMTGIAHGHTCKLDLRQAAHRVIQTNQQAAKRIGINCAKRTTCLKPEGTVSTLLSTSSGIHDYEAPYFFRSIEVGKTEAIYQHLKEAYPMLVEDKIGYESTHAIIRIPIQAPEGAYTKSQSTAISLLERIRRYNVEWVREGHVEGANTHNVSSTVSVQEHEWDDVQEWMWDNREDYTAISTFPYWGGTHRQLPFSPCTEQEFLEGMRYIAPFDFSKVKEYEDGTSVSQSVACSGNVCEIL